MPTLSLETLNGGPNSALLYASGMPAALGQVICSAADLELYRRKVASVASITVDPADAPITDYNAVSYERIGALAVPAALPQSNAGSWAANATKTQAPAIGAGVRTLMFSATGRGFLRLLGYYQSNASTNARFEVIADGRVLLVNTYTPLAQNPGHLFAGEYQAGGSGGQNYVQGSAFKIAFRRSLQVYFTPTSAQASAGSANFFAQVQSEA